MFVEPRFASSGDTAVLSQRYLTNANNGPGVGPFGSHGMEGVIEGRLCL